MPHELVTIPVSDLLLDSANARLTEEQPNQQATAIALAKQQGAKIVKLAADVVKAGLDPLALPAVVATGDQRKRYKVLEGNRRVLALKALETPSLVNPALDSGLQARLNKLSDEYSAAPIDRMDCVLFDTEESAQHWIEIRHTGQNEGIGLVEWDSDQKDRYAARHGTRSVAGQVIDFVEKHNLVVDDYPNSKGIITTLKRLLSTPDVRDRLGVDIANGVVYSCYPLDEISKSLGYVVDDLKSGNINVGDVYTADQRREYAAKIPRSARPLKSKRLEQPVPLDDIDSGSSSRKAPKKTRRRKRARKRERTTLIPQNCQLDIDPPRINEIYIELLSLNLEEYPNAGAISFRVFLELSVDSYLSIRNLMDSNTRRNTPLAKRMKATAADLRTRKKIDSQVEIAVKRAADNKRILDASTVLLNQYVHNPHIVPKPSELRAGWDEIQPFMEAIWPV